MRKLLWVLIAVAVLVPSTAGAQAEMFTDPVGSVAINRILDEVVASHPRLRRTLRRVGWHDNVDRGILVDVQQPVVERESSHICGTLFVAGDRQMLYRLKLSVDSDRGQELELQSRFRGSWVIVHPDATRPLALAWYEHRGRRRFRRSLVVVNKDDYDLYRACLTPGREE